MIRTLAVGREEVAQEEVAQEDSLVVHSCHIPVVAVASLELLQPVAVESLAVPKPTAFRLTPKQLLYPPFRELLVAFFPKQPGWCILRLNAVTSHKIESFHFLRQTGSPFGPLPTVTAAYFFFFFNKARNERCRQSRAR
jgi:hypothetical protein